jgi:hypothetical protein
LDGISKATVLLVTPLVLSACRRTTPIDVMMITRHCTTHVRSKGPTPQLPHAPSLRPGFGGVVGTVADSGGALPHYSILAAMLGGAANAPHASATADSLGGFLFDSLPPGRYRLLVRAFAHRADSTDVEVATGQVDTVRLFPQFFQCVR